MFIFFLFFSIGVSAISFLPSFSQVLHDPDAVPMRQLAPLLACCTWHMQ